MARRVLQIFPKHLSAEDRVSHWLREAGWHLDQRHPADGDALPDDTSPYHAVVVYGGPQSANDETPDIRATRDLVRDWTQGDRPFLGLCLGGQILAAAHGGRVGAHPEGYVEAGYTTVEPSETGRDVVPDRMAFYAWHKEGFDAPESGEVVARGSPRFPHQGFRLGPRMYGFQFHPEATVPIYSSWMTEAGHMFARPGAQPREDQFRAAVEHETAIAAWLDGFLSTWLG